MITIRMFLEASPQEYAKMRVAPKDFYGVVQISRESIRKTKESEIEVAADQELQAFIIMFKKELIRSWKRLHRK